VVSWGDKTFGGTAPTGLSGITQIFSNSYAFAALRGDGTVVCWGPDIYGGTVPSGLSGVTQIFSTKTAFAALKGDGSVISWGSSANGGTAPTGLGGVIQIFSTDTAFAALKRDGTVVCWGDSRSGGNAPLGLSGVTQIVANSYAFTALKSDGRVVSWGNAGNGGSAPQGLTGVVGFADPFTDDRLTLPTISLTLASARVMEDGAGNLVYTFTRSSPITSALTINYSVSGTAALATDYTGIPSLSGPKTLTFLAGSATATVTVDPTADSLCEDDETVELTLAPGSGYTLGTPGAVVGTIANDDLPTVTLSVSPASVLEDGVSNLIFTFSRTGPTSSGLAINYTVAGTATLGTDYLGIAATPATKVVTFLAGSSTAIVTVDPIADSTIEADETVQLTLAPGSGYSVGTPGAVVGTIANDDVPTVTLSVSPASVLEDGVSNLIFTFSRTGPTSSGLAINYTVAGTATLGTDYLGIAATPATKVVTFLAGSSTAIVTVDPIADSTIEADETVQLTLAPGSGYSVGTPGAVVGTIGNDDVPTVILSVSPASVLEDGVSNLVFTFSRTGPTSSGLAINYTVAGTATLGTDYLGIAATPATKVVTFLAGSSTAIVTVDPIADSTIEADETVQLTLAPGSGYSVGTPGAVVGTIGNDDVPTVTLSVSPASVLEDGVSNLVFTFSRTGPTSSGLAINYTVAGTATLGTDYLGIAATPATKVVTFLAGSSTAIVTVDPTADSTNEADETVQLTLAPGSGYSVGTPGAVVGTIANDDVQASSTTTLTANQSSLLLLGLAAINGTGNALANVIKGNGANNILDGKEGVDVLTGLGGADTFLFSTQSVFGAATADHITDFSSAEADKIQISRSAFGLAVNASVSFTAVSTDAGLNAALGSASLFVYDSRNGSLFWNQNGMVAGFGSGGIFAILDNKPALTVNPIGLI
jgi:hypothetical protein